MRKFLLFFLISTASALAQPHALVQRYCSGCHSPAMKAGRLVLSGLDFAKAGDNAAIWEKVLRQVQSGAMPPVGLPRPDAAALQTFTRTLAESLDKAALTHPDPGAPMPHRLNRLEYSNAIRDLLALDTQPGLRLPVDESGFGFDNMADLLSMSPSLLERYLSVAQFVSRQAIGDLKMKPEETTYGSTVRSLKRAPSADELPLGASGGLAFRHYFPLDAQYDLRVTLAGSTGDGALPTPYQVKLPVKAGLRAVVVTFVRESGRPEAALKTTGRAFPGPGGASEKAEMDLRIDGVSVKRWTVPQRTGAPAPDVATTVLAGPYEATSRGQTPARARIFACRPTKATEEEPCARTILASLTKRAFRRPSAETDVRPLLRFYTEARRQGLDFDESIGRSLQAMLVSPDFLFRIERDPKHLAPGTVHPLNDYELASRLSFFLWSSIPDDELLRVAGEGKLRQPAFLRAQVKRLIADPRSDALIQNFGGQWLFLRTLANAKPDADIFANFDENLRQAFQRETELYLANIFRNERSALELLDSNYTYLNERLAQHYGVPNVYGSHFRQVQLPDTRRGGLLGQGSILTVTSYPNRTSVVQRGKWILENLLGTPPPPPPADVPELPAKAKDGRKLSLREAMETHRANAVCASCHSRMDPIGFALENFNAVGEWRADDGGVHVDAKGKLPNGAEFEGPGGLKTLLVNQHRDEFVQTMVEKLLTYALGRGLEARDRPTVRLIARQTAADQYRMAALVTAIVESAPFQMRRSR
ncbi:MAG: DUF1592 domain-containing protein [Bryobacteraceae bacterium]|nr:DUF1592 domain-containing protein [Bryobacteraceae bacterium]